jgi:hypothetical protein
MDNKDAQTSSFKFISRGTDFHERLYRSTDTYS